MAIAITTTSTNPLSDLSSFLLQKTGGTNDQGKGVSYDFTIDNASKAKVMEISFDYIVNSGTFTVGSSTTDSDIIVYIYDKTNAVMIEPSNFKLLSNSTTISNVFSATFQTASNSTSYRLIFHQARTTTNNFELKIDNVSVSRSQYVYGSPVTDWQSYVPTILATVAPSLGTGATQAGRWRRVGGDAEIEINIVAGATGSSSGTGTYYFSLPSIVIDPSKIVAPQIAAGISTPLGIGSKADSGGTAIVDFKVIADSVNNNGVLLVDSTAAAVTSALNGVAASRRYTLTAKVPILGWSSNVQMSDSADTRLLSGSYGGTTSTVTNTTDTLLIYSTATSKDTHGSYNTSTGVWTAFKSGTLNVFATFKTAFTASVANAEITIKVRLNGTNKLAGSVCSPATVAQNYQPKVYGKIDVVAGDQIQFYTNQQAIAGAQTITNDVTVTYFTIEEAKGPSAIAATETVACRYTNTAGTSIAAGGTTPVPFVTKDYDTTGSWNGTTFTAPISGKYEVKCGIFYATGSFTGTSKNINIRKNTTLVSYISIITPPSTATYNLGMNGSDTINLLAGDTLDFGLAHNEGTARSLDTLNGANHISITRVGN